MAMVEKMYGPEIFYEDAANIMMQEAYPAAIDESGVDIVSQPTVDVVQLEKGNHSSSQQKLQRDQKLNLANIMV